MTTSHDQQDIERILRATLSEVAGTVTDAGRVTAPVGADRRRSRHGVVVRRAAPLAVAAAVAAVAAAIALQSSPKADKNQPITPPTSLRSAPASPTPHPSVSSAPAVRLNWWTTPIPAGYTKAQRMVTAQFSGEQFIKSDDPQRNTIGNGGGPAGVLVRRWTRGAFNAATVRNPVRMHVGTHAGLYGATPAGLFDEQVPYAKGNVPTLAVEIAPDRWVTFAGATAQTERRDELIRVATTVLSATTTTPMTVPFRLTGLPTGLHALGASEDLDPKHPYGLTIDITNGPITGSTENSQQTTDLRIQIWQQNSIPTSPAGGHVIADNRTGRLDSTGHAAYFPIGARLADLELDGPHASPAALKAMLSRLNWSPDPSNERTWYDAADLFR